MDTKLKLTDNAIIDLLGGTAKVARMCKVDPAAVSNWRIRGIPSDKYMFLGAKFNGFAPQLSISNYETSTLSFTTELDVQNPQNGCE